MDRPQDATDKTSLGWPTLPGFDPEYELNIRELLRGSPVRLRYTKRYSTCRVNHQENVAEHSYYVCLYAALIGQWLQNHPQTISNIGEPTLLTHRLNWELLMIRATIHDLEESWTGDMPRHFKYSTPELLKVLDDAALAAFRRVIEPLVTPRWVERLVENWLLAKDSRLEGKVIAFADFLSVLSFVVQEYESGNRNAFEHAQRLEEYMSLFKDTGYDAMRPLVEQSEVVVQEVFHAIA